MKGGVQQAKQQVRGQLMWLLSSTASLSLTALPLWVHISTPSQRQLWGGGELATLPSLISCGSGSVGQDICVVFDFHKPSELFDTGFMDFTFQFSYCICSFCKTLELSLPQAQLGSEKSHSAFSPSPAHHHQEQPLQLSWQFFINIIFCYYLYSISRHALLLMREAEQNQSHPAFAVFGLHCSALQTHVCES